MGTVITLIWFLARRSCIVFKYLEIDKSYYVILARDNIMYFAIFLADIWLCRKIVGIHMGSSNMLQFFADAIIIEVINILIILLLFFKNENFKFILNKVIRPIIKK